MPPAAKRNNVQEENSDFLTRLFDAVKARDRDERGESIDCCNAVWTLFQKIDLAGALVDVNAQDKDGKLLLCEAIKAKSLDNTVKLLKEKGADPLKEDDAFDFTALHYAADFNRLEIAHYLLLDCNVSPNLKNKEGVTPLHLAAEGGKLAMVELLLLQGASPWAKNNKGETPYSLAEDDSELKKLLAQQFVAKQAVLRELAGYEGYKTSLLTSWFSFGHHHSGRVRHLRREIESCENVQEIKGLLVEQKRLFEVTSEDGASAYFDESEPYSRWTDQNLLRNNKQGGFYRALSRAIASCQEAGKPLQAEEIRASFFVYGVV